MAGKQLSLEERKFVLKCHWKTENAIEVQRRFRREFARPPPTRRAHLDAAFPNTWIGRRGAIEYPARSPDLTPMDFFLWGYLKDKVYRTKPRTIDALKMEIERQCRDFPNDLFRDVCDSLGVRYQRCLDNDGRQFEHLRS